MPLTAYRKRRLQLDDVNLRHQQAGLARERDALRISLAQAMQDQDPTKLAGSVPLIRERYNAVARELATVSARLGTVRRELANG